MNGFQTCAIFMSDRFPPNSDSDTNLANLDTPLGIEISKFILAKLVEHGINIPRLDLQPDQDESGWNINFDYSGQYYGLYIQWIPLGEPSIDYWNLQLSVHMGIFRSLFGGKPTEKKLNRESTSFKKY